MILALTDFRRPSRDNGRGVRGSSTAGWNGGEQGLDYWIAELEALGIKWFQLLDDNSSSLQVCRKLVEAGIYPVVRVLRHDPPPNDAAEPNPGHLNSGEEETIKKLIDVGVLYFETNTEPNLGTQWKNGAIPTDLEEAAKLVALNWLFDARFILEAGGYPGLPAASVGSDLDLVGALASLGRQDILLEGCWIAIHNYGLNRPLDYPADSVHQIGAPLPPNQYDLGPYTKWVWWNLKKGQPDTRDDINQMRASSKQPGSTIFQNHACFREHEYFAALAQKHFGRPIPILTTEGGYSVGRRQDPRYPRVSPQMQAELTVAMFDYMLRSAPDYYFACMPSLLVPSTPARTDPEAWYSDFWQRTFKSGTRANTHFPPFPVQDAKVGPSLPVVAAVKAMPAQRGAGAKEAVPQPVEVSTKPSPSPAPPPVNEESLYLIREGDTLAGIAQKFDAALPSLMALNRIADPARLVPGTKLIIPARSAMPQSAPPTSRTAAAAPHAGARVRIPAPPKIRGGDQIDARLFALNIRLLDAMVPRGYPFWKLIRAEYQDPTEAGGRQYVSYTVLDEKESPVPAQRVFQGLVEERAEARTDGSGTAVLTISASFSPERGETGPYSAWVDGLPSDRVTGLGLPDNRQVNFRLIWQRAIK